MSMIKTLPPFTAEDLSMQWDADHQFPFVENENANITGFGHQDKAEFASAINRYDEICNGEPYSANEQWAASDISHMWAVRVTEETCRARIDDGTPVTEETPGAFPITTLWGAR